MSKRARARMVVEGVIAIGMIAVVWLFVERISALWG